MKSSFLSLRWGLLTGPRAIALTLAATTIAALLSMAATLLAREFPFSLFFVAVAISAWFGGLRQGILAVVIAPFVVDYFVLPLRAQPRDLLRVVLWLVTAGAVAFMVGKLRSFQGRAQNVLANMDEGVVILDHHWRVVYANEPAAQMIGRSQEEMIGRNYWKICPEVEGSPTELHLRRCVEEQTPVRFNSQSHRRQKYFQVRAYPLPEGLSVFIQDVSIAKESEAKLQEILDRLENAHRAARTGTWEWNLRTNETFWSEEIPRIHGIPGQEFDGKLETCFKTIHPEDVPILRARVRDALKSKQEYYAEFRVILPNAETRWVCSHGRVIQDRNGKPERMVGITTDFTERHREEEALRQSEKLAAVGRLAATIAHEINNPLEAVTNLIYLLRRNPGKCDTEDLLSLADAQLTRVNHIAKQTLGFYQDRNVAEAVDVVQTLESLLSILQSRISAKQLRVEREWENATLLRGFRGELSQVFSNLLTNAIDASPNGGRLIVRVKPERNGSEVIGMRIEIEDFGAGIQIEDQPKIFEPFFTTKSDVGTGLGLWVTKGLVEKNGGTISFRSNCQNLIHGTRFTVVFPVAPATMGTQPAA